MNRSLEARRQKIVRALVRIKRALTAEQKQLARIEARLAVLVLERRMAA